LIGTSIAWRLAQRGFDVTVIDAGNLGGEASSAGAGMLAPASEAKRISAWFTLGLESLALYPAFLEELRAESSMDVEYRTCGSMVLDPGYSATAELHRRFGVRVERRAEGFLYPDEAIVDPVALLRALRHAAQQRGVRFLIERVAEVESTSAHATVLAAGAWSNTISVTHRGEPLMLPAASPVKGHLIAFQMQPGFLGPFLRRGHTYMLQRADGLVIVGATEEHVGFDTSVQDAACEQLHRSAVAMAPALAMMEPVRRWMGFRPGPENDDGPVLRRVPETNLWLAYGHYRNGILLTPVTARRLSEEIAASLD
jgi:glycine oxidase